MGQIMSKITNSQARAYIMRHEEFKTGNETIFGHYHYDFQARGIYQKVTYVVYSYGYHFPMYVYDYEAEQWVGNRDKYSRTTSKHQSITRPDNVSFWVDTDTLCNIARLGLAKSVAWRMAA